MTNFWSGFIIFLTLLTILGTICLLLIIQRYREKTSNVNDIYQNSSNDIKECNKPMPRWWCLLFGLTILTAIFYLVLYPGLGSFPGLLHWSSTMDWNNRIKTQRLKTEPLFAKYAKLSFNELIQNPQAMTTAKYIYIENCSMCHGLDGHGITGFPKLSDNDWLYGKTPKQIKKSILLGRSGFMPAFGDTIKDDQKIQTLIEYVLSLSGQNKTTSGKPLYQSLCATCHGINGEGFPQIGAPNLTDNIWMYGGSTAQISETIRNGRQGKMPAFQRQLGKEKVHLVAAYVFSLSH